MDFYNIVSREITEKVSIVSHVHLEIRKEYSFCLVLVVSMANKEVITDCTPAFVCARKI